jgi:hypothetical protein
MDTRSLDDLLLIGATLIEALELRSNRTSPHSPKIRHKASPVSAKLKAGAARLLIPYDPSTPVAYPVWGEAVLETADSYGDLLSQDATLCLYLAICDAGETHIFEYAVEEKESGVLVKYARAHEYVRGNPQIYDDTIAVSSNVFYLWIDLPSEKVYYFTMTKRWDHGPGSAPLLEWISSKLELVEDPSVRSADTQSTPADLHPRRLRPASRYVLQGLPWGWWADIRPPRAFGSARENIENEFDLQLQCSIADGQEFNFEVSDEFRLKLEHPASCEHGRKLVPQTGRSTTLRFERKIPDVETDNEDEEEVSSASDISAG